MAENLILNLAAEVTVIRISKKQHFPCQIFHAVHKICPSLLWGFTEYYLVSLPFLLIVSFKSDSKLVLDEYLVRQMLGCINKHIHIVIE